MRIYLLSLGLFFSCVALVWADMAVRSLHVLQSDQSLNVSATLPVDEDIISDIQDALKSGITLKLTHKLKLERAGWLKGEVSKTEKSVYLAYDSLGNRYQLGESLEDMQELFDFSILQNALFVLNDVTLELPEPLVRGKKYRILLTVHLEDSQPPNWLNWLSFAFVWESQDIQVEIPYVAR